MIALWVRHLPYMGLTWVQSMTYKMEMVPPSQPGMVSECTAQKLKKKASRTELEKEPHELVCIHRLRILFDSELQRDRTASSCTSPK